MFQKITIASLLLLTGAAQSAASRPFAVACTGTAQFSDNQRGVPDTRRYELPPQVYVFDEAGRRVQLALEPRQEFEDVCFRGGTIDRIDFAPGLINVHSEAPGQICDLTVSRVTGHGEYFSHADFPGGRYSRIEFDMTCAPADIPVFDRSRNRF